MVRPPHLLCAANHPDKVCQSALCATSKLVLAAGNASSVKPAQTVHFNCKALCTLTSREALSAISLVVLDLHNIFVSGLPAARMPPLPHSAEICTLKVKLAEELSQLRTALA